MKTKPAGAPAKITRPVRTLAALLLSMALMLLGLNLFAPLVASASGANLFGTSVPATETDGDTNSVELGVRFTSSTDGAVSAVRFYKGPQNTGPHPVSLWDSRGNKLGSAEATGESTSGWQTAAFAAPITVTKDTLYVASYLAPNGRYSSTENAFDQPYTNGPLSVPAGGGVYQYGAGGFPQQSFHNSNYFVDVEFQEADAPAPTPTPAPAPDPAPDGPGVLALPRIPWEGGPDYWKQFNNANAAGWSDPGFFPIVASFNGISSNEEAAFDKDLGINTYTGMWEGTPYSLFEDNGVFWIGSKLNSSFTDQSRNWVGDFLDDEVDGRYTPAAGQAHLQELADSLAGNGHFKFANFTQIIMSHDINPADAEKYVNNYTDAVSIDMYWYTIPFCDWTPYRGGVYLNPINQANCRTASSYGKTVKSLRERDAADGKLQSVWQFVEVLNGGPGEGPFVANVTGGQLRGAVMSSVINEARGIVYFNQSLSGPCKSGGVFREAQVTPNFCGTAQVAAAKVVNNQIKELAPVLNTQSYQYSFGTGLDTMLKTHDGSAYVFAMVDGESQPGSRTFTLPDGLDASSVEVLFEDRTLPVDGDSFTDNFAAEYTYHIYKITL